MTDLPEEPRLPNWGARGRALAGQHGGALVGIAVASAVGIAATAGFQVTASRKLGPQDFSLLTAFLAFINIAAIGSTALRNAVAVDVADARPRAAASSRFRLDSSAIEALTLGVVCTVALVIVAPWISGALQSSASAPLIAAATVLPYFLFARSLGILQGRRRVGVVVWWSTLAQVVQLVLALVVLTLGWGVQGVLLVYLATMLAVTWGSWRMTRGINVAVSRRPFNSTTTVVLLLSIAFAWLTSVDVILVRSGVVETAAGSYAAGAVLVKMTLVLPATLSLYLLPRFVSSKGNQALSRLGVNLSVGLTLVAGFAIAGVLALAGEPITNLVFGGKYADTAVLLPLMALAWIPWAMTQAILVRITAVASQAGLTVLVVAAVVQWVGAKALLPNLDAMIALNGAVGLVAFALLFVIHLTASRDSGTTPRE